MTESEWLAGTDPEAMRAELAPHTVHTGGGRGYQSASLAADRKLRLFAAACCRQVWDGEVCGRCKGKRDWHDALTGDGKCYDCRGTGRLTDPRSRRAVEAAERYADGEAAEEELESACRVATADSHVGARAAASWACCPPHWAGGPFFVQNTLTALAGLVPPAAQAALLRCLFGNPWRPVPVESSGLLLWPLVPVLGPSLADRCIAIARAIYADRDFAALPVLADALEEAGCADAAALAHCREPLHARGCWVLDLILGKE